MMGGCLFENVTNDMTIYKDEIFRPVMSVVRAKRPCSGLWSGEQSLQRFDEGGFHDDFHQEAHAALGCGD